jgi:hypothetical protein
VEEGAEDEKILRPIVVECPANNRTRDEHDEDLNTRNPGNRRWGIVGQLVGLVVVLENTKTVEPPKRAEQAAESSKQAQPCVFAAVGELARMKWIYWLR